MANDREVLQSTMERIKRAIDRGTGTSLSDEEVKVVGRLLYALGSSVLPTPPGRQACAVCGQPEHDEGEVGTYPRHAYQPGLLVPLVGANHAS